MNYDLFLLDYMKRLRQKIEWGWKTQSVPGSRRGVMNSFRHTVVISAVTEVSRVTSSEPQSAEASLSKGCFHFVRYRSYRQFPISRQSPVPSV